MSTTAVDARFAGGTIYVETEPLHDVDNPPQMVRLNAPGGYAFPLFPHEAEALAAALIEQARIAREEEAR